LKNYLQLTRHTGNTTLFLAVEMSLISVLQGLPFHIHAEGLRGTGKTTIMRSVKQILPKITRIKGCLYNCDPDNPHCPQHSKLTAEEIAEIGTEEIPIPFLEISHSAKIGTVAGTIDLSKLTNPTKPEAALLPGIIPQAHRGIIFVDEINRLADTSPEITDVLLDAMGTKPGRVQIEETGLPLVEVPVSASVWAASNPDEDVIDLLLAAFPGGSITGTPKIRSMDVIEELEPVKRGIYTGSIGYLGFDGNVDLSIVIRTFIIKDGTAYFQVGGGITDGSEPDAEYWETIDKARALLDALGCDGEVKVCQVLPG
jgi:hypothetical protein